MPSQLVDEVRRMIRDREEAGAPLTALERTLLTAAIHPRSNAPADLVDELEGAITAARRDLLPLFNRTGQNPQLIAGRRALTRLVLAARAVLDYDPAREPAPEPTPLPKLDPDRRLRADVDG